jgi:adenine-specific DNA-methyltransferase
MTDQALALPASADTLLGSAASIAERCRAAASDDLKKTWGQYFTSPAIAAFMAGLVEVPRGDKPIRILDPGAGTGILGIALAERLVGHRRRVHLVAVELEARAAEHLTEALRVAAKRLGAGFSFEVLRADVLDLDAPLLGATPVQPFDLAISNPPYFKVSPTEVRGGDAPNVYARFMEVASRLLVPGGQLCFIVPRSFASGLYFQRFRRRFHASMRLQHVHVFESRRAAFKVDGVLQENLIVHYRRAPEDGGDVVISSSAGEEDLGAPESHAVARGRVVVSTDRDATIFLPIDSQDLRLMSLFASFRFTLGHLGFDVSTGPVVPFRATHELIQEPKRTAVVPMLWLHHVKASGVTWPLGEPFRKPEHIRASAPAKLLVANTTYVLVRRFSSKEEHRRLVAAVLHEGALPGAALGLENHLNFIHRPHGKLTDDEATGLAALLNSSLFDAYFRISSGNTQVSATELRLLPLPGPEVLARVAKRIKKHGLAATDRIVEELFRAAD